MGESGFNPLAFVNTILKYLPYPFLIMFVLAFITGAMLFLPCSWQEQMGTAAFTWEHRPAEWIVFSFCTLMVLLHRSGIGLRDLRKRYGFHHRMNNLTADEKRIFMRFQHCDDLIMWPWEKGVPTLEMAGLMTRRPENLGNDQVCYVLDLRAKKLFFSRHVAADSGSTGNVQ